MTMDPSKAEGEIVSSWGKNVRPWVDAVRSGAIESRRLATDDAVVAAVGALNPQHVLDVGCGEGWLVRRLSALGMRVTGVDGEPDLVASARAAGVGTFLVCRYDDFGQADFLGGVDLAVCNFSLLGEGSAEAVLAALSSGLAPGSHLIVQTLHPLGACGDASYCDGWREGTWAGIEGSFTAPAPWYFRTLAGWLALLDKTGWLLASLQEPLHPQTGKPASLLLTAHNRA